MCCVWLKNCTVAIVSLRPNAETWSNKTFNKGVICYQVNLTCLFFQNGHVFHVTLNTTYTLFK